MRLGRPASARAERECRASVDDEADEHREVRRIVAPVAVQERDDVGADVVRAGPARAAVAAAPLLDDDCAGGARQVRRSVRRAAVDDHDAVDAGGPHLGDDAADGAGLVEHGNHGSDARRSGEGWQRHGVRAGRPAARQDRAHQREHDHPGPPGDAGGAASGPTVHAGSRHDADAARPRRPAPLPYAQHVTAVAARLERLRRRPPARLVGAVMIVAALAVGVYARSAGVELGTGFAPFTMLERRVPVDGPWRPLLPLGVAVVAAIALLRAGPRVGRHLFPVAAFAVALVARAGLATTQHGIDEWWWPFTRPGGRETEYQAAFGLVDRDPLGFIDHFAERVSGLPVHPSGHPVGATLAARGLQ